MQDDGVYLGILSERIDEEINVKKDSKNKKEEKEIKLIRVQILIFLNS